MENPGIKWGMYLAVASIALSLIAYIINPMLLYQFKFGLIGIVLSIVFMVLAAKEQRTNIGGFASFGDVFKPAFLTGIISIVAGVLFNYVMANFVDTGLADVAREASLDSAKWMMELFGAPEETIEEAMKQTAEQLEGKDLTGAGAMLQSLVGGAIFLAIIALFVALGTKKKNPADF